MTRHFNILITVIVISLTAFSSAAPSITISNGITLHGSTASSGTVYRYLGIPYAMPPVNDRRWAPPQPWVASNNETSRTVTSFGQACTQKKQGKIYGGEDCLFLNVFVHTKHTPGATVAKLPVAFWIHGGTYISGDGSQYDAQELINLYNGNVIIVTINYRLNIFGFFGSEELRQLDPESGSTGNLGLQDQRMAMRWVQENIGAFGGDKRRVTLFGQSAGAGSVSCHVTMKKSEGLFSAVIMESGGFASWIVQNMTFAQKGYHSVLQASMCTTVSCLQNLSTSELFNISQHINSASPLLPTAFIPVVDFVELMSHPWISQSQGNVTNIPILIGTNSDEGVSYLPSGTPTALTEFEFFYMLVKVFDFGVYRDELEELYLTNVTYPEVYDTSGVLYSDYWWASQRFIGDYFFTCPVQYTLDHVVMSADSSVQCGTSTPGNSFCSNVYVYHNEFTLPNRGAFVEHGFELPLVFHFQSYLTTSAAVAMADIVASYWGNFFVTQDPSGTASGVSFDVPEQQLPKWETYSHTSPNTLVRFTNSNTPLGGGVTTVTTLKKSECSVLNTMMKEKMRMDYPQSYPEQDEGGDGPNDHHSSSFLKVIEKMAVLVGVAGGCVLVFVVYWGYQTLYGVSHHEAQRFLALDASADLEAAAARRAHY